MVDVVKLQIITLMICTEHITHEIITYVRQTFAELSRAWRSDRCMC